jgi:hypothetical protein
VLSLSLEPLVLAALADNPRPQSADIRDAVPRCPQNRYLILRTGGKVKVKECAQEVALSTSKRQISFLDDAGFYS